MPTSLYSLMSLNPSSEGNKTVLVLYYKVLGVVGSVETLHMESRALTSVRTKNGSDTIYQEDRSLKIQIYIIKKHQFLYNLNNLHFPIVHTIHFVVRVQFNLVCSRLRNKQKPKACFGEMKSRDSLISLRYFTPKCSNGFCPMAKISLWSLIASISAVTLGSCLPDYIVL